MIPNIQSLYQRALIFAGEKHSDQHVPASNSNYVVHLSNVAMEILIAYHYEPTFDLEKAIPLALLHDCLEDTTATQDELTHQFGADISKGVLALTKNSELPSKSERMEDSLNRILRAYTEVRLVKIADRITNLQPPPSTWNDVKKEAYWKEAQFIFERLCGVHSYLDERLASKISEYRRYW